MLCLFHCRRSRDVNQLEVKVDLDQYAVPANIRTAVNHSVDSATATSGSIAKDAARIGFLQIVLYSVAVI